MFSNFPCAECIVTPLAANPAAGPGLFHVRTRCEYDYLVNIGVEDKFLGINCSNCRKIIPGSSTGVNICMDYYAFDFLFVEGVVAVSASRFTF